MIETQEFQQCYRIFQSSIADPKKRRDWSEFHRIYCIAVVKALRIYYQNRFGRLPDSKDLIGFVANELNRDVNLTYGRQGTNLEYADGINRFIDKLIASFTGRKATVNEKVNFIITRVPESQGQRILVDNFLTIQDLERKIRDLQFWILKYSKPEFANQLAAVANIDRVTGLRQLNGRVKTEIHEPVQGIMWLYFTGKRLVLDSKKLDNNRYWTNYYNAIVNKFPELNNNPAMTFMLEVRNEDAKADKKARMAKFMKIGVGILAVATAAIGVGAAIGAAGATTSSTVTAVAAGVASASGGIKKGISQIDGQIQSMYNQLKGQLAVSLKELSVNVAGQASLDQQRSQNQLVQENKENVDLLNQRRQLLDKEYLGIPVRHWAIGGLGLFGFGVAVNEIS
ncbi:MAG: hypothetical protein AAF363_15800 [Bacteroidota bacterium]